VAKQRFPATLATTYTFRFAVRAVVVEMTTQDPGELATTEFCITTGGPGVSDADGDYRLSVCERNDDIIQCSGGKFSDLQFIDGLDLKWEVGIFITLIREHNMALLSQVGGV
jgi:hypothetical protein